MSDSMLIISPYTDPYKNLALEEYILKHLKSDKSILFYGKISLLLS